MEELVEPDKIYSWLKQWFSPSFWDNIDLNLAYKALEESAPGDKMKQEINTTKFDKNDPKFIEFFEEHGWVVLNGNLSSESIDGGLNQWANLKKRYADEMGISLVEYENEVSPVEKSLAQ